MIAFVSWLWMYGALLLHPFYISMTDINYNNKSKSVEVSVRIFTDDFEKTLRKSYESKVDLNAKDQVEKMKPMVQEYISKHLIISLNEKKLNLKFLGYQQEEESTWCYFEATNIPSPKKIRVNNSLLYDYKEEQINMVHFKVNGKEQTEKLNWPDKEIQISF